MAKKFTGKEVKKIQIKTNKQVGDIAGTKSKKFFDFFLLQLNKDFIIRTSDFAYNGDENVASLFFTLGKKKDEIIKGPHISHGINVKKFKKAHPAAYIKAGFSYVKVRHTQSFEQWLLKFKRKYKKILGQMGIVELKIIN